MVFSPSQPYPKPHSIFCDFQAQPRSQGSLLPALLSEREREKVSTRKALLSSVGFRKRMTSRSPRGSPCDSCKLCFDRPLWFVWWSDVCFEVLSCFFDHPSIDSTKKMPLHLFGEDVLMFRLDHSSLNSASRRSFQRMLLSNILWMAPDRMAFVKKNTTQMNRCPIGVRAGGARGAAAPPSPKKKKNWGSERKFGQSQFLKTSVHVYIFNLIILKTWILT